MRGEKKGIPDSTATTILPSSNSEWAREKKKNYLLIFLYRNNFLFLIQFEGSKTDSWNVVNMSNFSLSFPLFDFQINKDGLKCLLFDPFLPSPCLSYFFHLYLAICDLKAFSSSSSNVFINFSVYCILIFVFLSQKTSTHKNKIKIKKSKKKKWDV